MTKKNEEEKRRMTKEFIAGYKLFKAGKYVPAFHQFIRSNDSQSLNFIGIMYKEGYLNSPFHEKTALKYFQHAAKFGNEYAHINIGDIHLKNKDTDSAIKAYEAANNDIADTKLGYIYYQNGDYDLAYHYFIKANNIISYSNLAHGCIEGKFLSGSPYYACYYLIKVLKEKGSLGHEKAELLKTYFSKLNHEDQARLLMGQIWYQETLNLLQLPKAPMHLEECQKVSLFS